MKIVMLGNFNVPYTSENDYLWTLREKLKCTVVPLQESRVSAEEIEREALQADYFFWIHTHGWTTPGKSMTAVLHNLKRAGVKTFAYHLDLYMGLERWKEYETSDYFKVQHFFTVDPQMADWLNENTDTKGHYIKAGVVERDCYIIDKEKTKDIIFVGSYNYHKEWPYRKKLIDWLKETYGERFELYGPHGKGVVRGDQLNQLYASAKIVIGDTLCPGFDYKGFWSDRVYETLGRGGFLIHPFILGLGDEFVQKQEAVFYHFDDFDGLKKLIDFYLDNDKEREAIRKTGHKFVKENCTYTNRLKQIFDILEAEPVPEVEEEPERDKWDVLYDRVNRLDESPYIHLGRLVQKKDVLNIIKDLRG